MAQKITEKETERLKRELAEALQAKADYIKYHKMECSFPETGPFRRDLYKKHILFMNASGEYSQLAIIAANRVGKTFMGAYLMALHLTGLYPDWYKGRRFTDSISAWAASVTSEATKKVLQFELMGNFNDMGSGMIPKDQIVSVVKKIGVHEAYETVYVRHTSGGLSELNFKSYDQGRDTFQGTKKQVIWLDEEPSDGDIYTECLTRTAGGEHDSGLIYCTFTPLSGLSPVVLSFLPNGVFDEHIPPNRFVINVGWNDVPHLSEQWKKDAAASYKPHERDARTKGLPCLGAGAIYPYLESDIVVQPFKIPEFWPKGYGMDVGINRTAVCWVAKDPNSGTFYIYSEYYAADGIPAVHASAIKSRGDWMTGVIDPSSDRRSPTDGKNLLHIFFAEGLRLVKADNAMESGMAAVCQLFETGRLKVFSTCTHWFDEFRKYRRDTKGEIPRHLQDHLMDAMRYFFVTGVYYMDTEPDERDDYHYSSRSGCDSVTGY